MISGSTDLGRFSFRVKVLQRRSQRMSSNTYVHTPLTSPEKRLPTKGDCGLLSRGARAEHRQ
jgi:hypothetical protein